MGNTPGRAINHTLRSTPNYTNDTIYSNAAFALLREIEDF